MIKNPLRLLLTNGNMYTDIEAGYFGRCHEQQIQRQFVKPLERLGYKVTVEPPAIT